jgi:rhomboid family GlyGly-CTERM serine protease
LAVVGLALALLPEAADVLAYDRERILAGEVWRLATGHAVHFSWTHAGYNLALFSVAGAWLERRDRALCAWLIVLTALASSLYFLVALPDMARYAGLSGVVSAMVVHLGLTQMRQPGPARDLWATILLLLAAKVAHEILIGKPLFATQDATLFQVAPAAHIIGAVVAVLPLMAVFPRILIRHGSGQNQSGRAATIVIPINRPSESPEFSILAPHKPFRYISDAGSGSRRRKHAG